MSARSPEPTRPVVAYDMAWMRVEDPNAPGAVRRRALEMAEQVGLDEDGTGKLAIVVTEVTTNLVKYAERGLAVLRLLRHGDVGGVQVVALDHGPGMRDVRTLFEDGASTAGTLGIGLGAVHRLASSYDVHSVPGTGTVITAAFWPDGGSPPQQHVAGLTRSLEDEDECGDGYAVRFTDRGWLLMLSDGLGHGSLAARASAEASRAFHAGTEESPAQLLRRMHHVLAGTRGAAVLIAHLDRVAGRLTCAGVGNIAGRIVGDGRPRSLVSSPGIVGHKMRTVSDVTHDVSPGDWLVLHSDGLSEKWDAAAYPGLLARTPLVVAATLLRDAGVRRDDAGVLVAEVTP